MESRALTGALSGPEAGWLRWLLCGTLVLNLFDGMLTLLVVQLGAAQEANPLMSAALQASPVAFMLFKLGLVSAGVLCLWSCRRSRLAHLGGAAVFAAYSAVMVWHVQSIEVIASIVVGSPV